MRQDQSEPIIPFPTGRFFRGTFPGLAWLRSCCPSGTKPPTNLKRDAHLLVCLQIHSEFLNQFWRQDWYRSVMRGDNRAQTAGRGQNGLLMGSRVNPTIRPAIKASPTPTVSLTTTCGATAVTRLPRSQSAAPSAPMVTQIREVFVASERIAQAAATASGLPGGLGVASPVRIQEAIWPTSS